MVGGAEIRHYDKINIDPNEVYMLPRILISCNIDEKIPAHRLHFAYAEALYGAGCLPIIAPAPLAPAEEALAELAAAQLAQADGLLLTGGGDMECWRFGEESQGLATDIEPRRDAWELALCAEARRRGLPILGICRGHQLINVSYGGTLAEDISLLGLPSDSHRKEPYTTAHHTVLVHDARLAAALGCAVGDEVGVNTMHHQAIGRVGEGLIAAATTADGLVEAVVGAGAAFVVGVQWHPEHLRDTEAGRALFDAFAAACGRA